MKKLTVEGIEIRLDDEFVSLTDIAKQNTEQKPDVLITSWIKNKSTLLFLNEWEKTYNPEFKPHQMVGFMFHVADNRNVASPKNYIKATNAIGLYTKSGRGGGTFAHPDIALNFCYWLSPPFQVWFVREFRKLKEQESQLKNLEFHISKITDHIDEARNWLDTIPHQNQKRNRLSSGKSKLKK